MQYASRRVERRVPCAPGQGRGPARAVIGAPSVFSTTDGAVVRSNRFLKSDGRDGTPCCPKCAEEHDCHRTEKRRLEKFKRMHLCLQHAIDFHPVRTAARPPAVSRYRYSPPLAPFGLPFGSLSRRSAPVRLLDGVPSLPGARSFVTCLSSPPATPLAPHPTGPPPNPASALLRLPGCRASFAMRFAVATSAAPDRLSSESTRPPYRGR